MLLHQIFEMAQAGGPGKPGADKRRSRLHIHQADGLTFPWGACGNVDLFLANPPYLASKNTDLSGYVMPQSRGQADSYLFFLRLAVQVVRPGGWIGLVLPDAVLARTNAADERRTLLAETTIHHLWHLANVFQASVGAVVIIAQKRPPASEHRVIWKRGRWLRTSSSTKRRKSPHIVQSGSHHSKMVITHENTIEQAVLQRQPGAELRYLLSEIQGTLLGDLHECMTGRVADSRDCGKALVALGEYVSIRRGEEIAKDSVCLRKLEAGVAERDEAWYPVLRGGVDIRPYSYPAASCELPASVVRKPLERYQRPKILITKSAGQLQATLDLRGHVVLQTLYLLHLRPERSACLMDDAPNRPCAEDELYFLLALLNSRLMRDYVYMLHTAYKWVQPQIEQHVLTYLPVPMATTWAEVEPIIQLARQLMQACDRMVSGVELKDQDALLRAEYESLYERQEQLVYALYARVVEATRGAC
jgi:hypothetical protein